LVETPGNGLPEPDFHYRPDRRMQASGRLVIDRTRRNHVQSTAAMFSKNQTHTKQATKIPKLMPNFRMTREQVPLRLSELVS